MSANKDKFDWTYFRRRIYIRNCTVEDLFRKWATPKGLTEWFIAEAEYLYGNEELRKADEIVKANDKYSWKFHRGSVVTGKVLEVKKNSLFKFTFGKKEPDSEEDVIVTVRISKKNGLCYFDIRQDNMSESNYGRVYYYISCNMGWMFHMNNLKSIFEAGHDLRVKGVTRMHVDAPSAYPLENYKWNEFYQKEYISAPREAVFKQWVTSENIIKWFIAEAVYSYDGSKIRKPHEKIHAGDNYSWTFFQGITVKGRIIDVIGNEFLSFTFGKKEPDSEEDVIVEVNFFAEGNNKTRIELHQKNISVTEYGKVNFNLSCMVGWSYFLMNLRSVFKTGNDLREKDKKLSQETQAYTLDR